MCEQCMAKTVHITDGEFLPGEFLPGWFLVQATCDSGYKMRNGDYGLVQCNDPAFIIPSNLKPIPDPSFGLSDEQVNAMSKEEIKTLDSFHDLVDIISKFLVADYLIVSYDLVVACKEAGWNPEVHGWRIECWLTHKMGEAIVKFEQKENDKEL